jgi:ArsR family transcriptional regulator
MAKIKNALIDRDTDVSIASDRLKAMAHPLRLKILCILGSNQVTVQEIVEECGTTQSNISQHLGILRTKGILNYNKEGNRVFYFIDDNRTLQLIKLMKELFCPEHSE